MTTQPTKAAELPEALRLAEILEGDYCPDWFYEQGVDEVSKELRLQHALLNEQQRTIEALNACINGEGSTTTENLRLVDRLHAQVEALRAQPAGAQVPEAVLQAIRAAGMHLIRGMNDVYSLIPAMNATAQPVEAATPAAPGVPSDAMVDAYLQAQRRAIEEADQFGRPNIGGLHTNTVREACRSGLKAALAAAPQPPAAEQSGGKNAQLATNSDPIAPGQQRSMAGPLAMGQRVGDGQHEAGRHTQAQGNKLLTVAERNLRRFLETAVFRDEADRQAALNCLEVLSDKRPSPQPAVTAGAVDEVAMVDAAMVEMANIVPPLKRSECARLIRAAMAAQRGGAA